MRRQLEEFLIFSTFGLPRSSHMESGHYFYVPPWAGLSLCNAWLTVGTFTSSALGGLLTNFQSFLRVGVDSDPVVDSRPALPG